MWGVMAYLRNNNHIKKFETAVSASTKAAGTISVAIPTNIRGLNCLYFLVARKQALAKYRPQHKFIEQIYEREAFVSAILHFLLVWRLLILLYSTKY